MRFSVVIPLYDKAETIADTIASVLAQTLPPIEILVVDDGSTDGGARRVAQMTHPLIRLVTQPNAGPGAARNRGFAEAGGEWVALIDGDDRWTPDHLVNLAGIIRTCPDADLVSAASRIVTSAKAALCGHQARESRSPPRLIDFFRDYRSEVLNASSVAIRQSVFAATGGFGHHASGEDLAYWIGFATDHVIAVSDRPTAVYVRGTNGIMEREQDARRRGAARPISPVFPALDHALASVAPDRRHAVRAFSDRTRLQYARSELYLGRTADARRLLAGVVTRPPAYWLYRLLTRVPPAVLRIAAGGRAALRRA